MRTRAHSIDASCVDLHKTRIALQAAAEVVNVPTASIVKNLARTLWPNDASGIRIDLRNLGFEFRGSKRLANKATNAGTLSFDDFVYR